MNENVSTEKAILLSAIEIMTTNDWCRGAMAKDRDNSRCAPEHPGAAQFCILGAISRAMSGVTPNPEISNQGLWIGVTGALHSALDQLYPEAKRCAIGHWNDKSCKDKEEALSLMRAAAEVLP